MGAPEYKLGALFGAPIETGARAKVLSDLNYVNTALHMISEQKSFY